MPRGIVKWFDAKKGYGFIVGPQEGRDIFVHYTHIQGDGFRSLRDGEQVDYELAESDKGLQARSVRPLAREPEAAGAPRASAPAARQAQPQQAQVRR
jgi:cold shock protein